MVLPDAVLGAQVFDSVEWPAEVFICLQRAATTKAVKELAETKGVFLYNKEGYLLSEMPWDVGAFKVLFNLKSFRLQGL